MGKPSGFLEIKRVGPANRPVEERVKDWNEVTSNLALDDIKQQGARCMDCGVPFCHKGCPVENIIPEWNDLVYHNRWDEAINALHQTNNFPEFTGRVCPAPCESSCVLAINDDAVTIKNIERTIADYAWNQDWIKPQIAKKKSNKQIAVIGSGPAGMAAAQQLARAGHSVDLYEQSDRIGGLLRYGIPDFKMAKSLIDRRMEQMQAEGVTFKTNMAIGKDIKLKDLKEKYAAVLLTVGAGKPRALNVPGNDAKGIYYAMDFLHLQNKCVAGDQIPSDLQISAKAKKVVVIGGGDTGADCVGTSNRHGASQITQIELMPKPPEQIPADMVWPNYPNKLRTSTSHEEGCERMWSINTKEVLKDAAGNVKGLKCVKVEWTKDSAGRMTMTEIKGSDFVLEADLVLLAMGFVSPLLDGLTDDLDIKLDQRGNVQVNENYETSEAKIFAAGDTKRGASLVVWAIREGREAASAINGSLSKLAIIK